MGKVSLIVKIFASRLLGRVRGHAGWKGECLLSGWVIRLLAAIDGNRCWFGEYTRVRFP
jgi:hypothetical protein